MHFLSDVILKKRRDEEDDMDTGTGSLASSVLNALSLSEDELRSKDADAMYDMILAYMEVSSANSKLQPSV